MQPLFQLHDSLRQHLVLFADLLGLRLDVRQFVGMRCGGNAEYGRRRYKGLFPRRFPMKSGRCRKRHRRLAIVDSPLVSAARFTAVLAIELAHDPSPLEANTPLRLQVTRLGKETVYSRDQEKIRTNYFCKSLQVNHAAVMKFRHRNSISSA